MRDDFIEFPLHGSCKACRQSRKGTLPCLWAFARDKSRNYATPELAVKSDRL
ncbi:MAG: hypothetical protein V7L20_18660 [Nostoc sp.]|uniref:hypothetical protein n=1 Tax=Nostoc sp. TaxID=1180 RepID=UPI002FF9CB1D